MDRSTCSRVPPYRTTSRKTPSHRDLGILHRAHVGSTQKIFRVKNRAGHDATYIWSRKQREQRNQNATTTGWSLCRPAGSLLMCLATNHCARALLRPRSRTGRLCAGTACRGSKHRGTRRSRAVTASANLTVGKLLHAVAVKTDCVRLRRAGNLSMPWRLDHHTRKGVWSNGIEATAPGRPLSRSGTDGAKDCQRWPWDGGWLIDQVGNRPLDRLQTSVAPVGHVGVLRVTSSRSDTVRGKRV